jgi:hypothetical protein
MKKLDGGKELKKRVTGTVRVAKSPQPKMQLTKTITKKTQPQYTLEQKVTKKTTKMPAKSLKAAAVKERQKMKSPYSDMPKFIDYKLKPTYRPVK